MPLLPEVYDQQKQRMISSGMCFDGATFDWMVEQLTHGKIRLVNGEVVVRDIGNFSGSGSTTLDNIRCHILLVACWLIEAYHFTYQRNPDLVKVSTQSVNLFGDDNIMGIDDCFSKICDREWSEAFFLHFNLKFKFFHVTHKKLDGHTFLGASFEERDGHYLACYDLDRLVYSILYDAKKMSLEGYMSKFLTLVVMSYATKKYSVMLDAFRMFCFSDFIVEKQISPEVSSYCLWAETLFAREDLVKSFYLGLEGGEVFDFFDFDPTADDCVLQAQTGPRHEKMQVQLDENGLIRRSLNPHLMDDTISSVEFRVLFPGEELWPQVIAYRGERLFRMDAAWNISEDVRQFATEDGKNEDNLVNYMLKYDNPFDSDRFVDVWGLHKHHGIPDANRGWHITRNGESQVVGEERQKALAKINSKWRSIEAYVDLPDMIWRAVEEQGPEPEEVPQIALKEMSEAATSMRAYHRAENVLNRLVGEKKLTQCGKEWLINALDPFHDRELKNLAGWPDVETGYSVVQKVKQTISLASPGGAVFPANWDLWVIQFPILDNRYCSRTDQRQNNMFLHPNTPSFQWGGVHAYAVAPGFAFDPMDVTHVVHLGVIEANVPYTTGVGRLIGIGFELVNTTAILNKQGSLTVFRQMQQSKNQMGVLGMVSGSVYPAGLIPATVTVYRNPPQLLQEVMLMPGSRTWDASEGCYCVGSFHSNENPPTVPGYDIPVWSTDDDLEEGTNTTDWYVPQVQASVVVGMNTLFTSLAIKQYPIHTSGAICSGLSPTSTLQLNANMVFERFVDQKDKNLLVLATPSAEYDPMALEIYSHAISQMPPGVTFKDNPLGEWFMDVIDQVSNFLSFIPHPMAQKIAATGQSIAGPYYKQNPRQKEAVVVLQQEPIRRKKTGKAKRNNALMARGVRFTPSLKAIQGPMNLDQQRAENARIERKKQRIRRRLANMGSGA
jgi:hypothetical protein